MFASSDKLLLYVDESYYPREVRWLDCSKSPPKPAEPTDVTRTIKPIKLPTNTQDTPAPERHIPKSIDYEIKDLCCVKKGDEQLLIVTAYNSYGRLRAFCRKSDVFKWQALCSVNSFITGKRLLNLRSLSSDGRGHLFVVNKAYHQNSTVEMFDTDGRYSGCVFKMDRIKCIRWHEKSSSLVVADKENSICLIKVNV